MIAVDFYVKHIKTNVGVNLNPFNNIHYNIKIYVNLANADKLDLKHLLETFHLKWVIAIKLRSKAASTLY